MNPKFICLSGKAGSGKDTSAKIFKSLLEESGNSVLIAHYADLLKYICKTFLGWNGEKDERGRNLLQYVGTDLVRKLNPDYWVDFIVDMATLFGNNYDYIIMADTRFKNEINKIKDTGYNVVHIRVTRNENSSNLNESQKNHVSERDLDSVMADYVLPNDLGFDELTDKIKFIIKSINSDEKFISDVKDMMIKSRNARKYSDDMLRKIIDAFQDECKSESLKRNPNVDGVCSLLDLIIRYTSYGSIEIDSVINEIKALI